MDKNNFVSLLNRYSRSSVSEALEVLALKQRYPYSQVLHALSAKVSKDHDFSTQQQELQLAAVYASDRVVLKNIISTVHGDDLKPNIGYGATSIENQPKTGSINKVEIQVQDSSSINVIAGINRDDLTEAILKDLKQLNKSRRDFELMFDDGATKIDNIKTEKIAETDTNVSNAESEADKTKLSKSKKERIIELAKAIESTPAPTEKPPIKKRTGQADVLIEEIESTKKAITPETEKQKAQIQVIDQFIKAQPIISNSKERPLAEPNADLSTIRSGEFGDNIVSETLVDILIKQGKKDKAIEVLKKLIWKFPQKKAYFAAQIEELKK